MSKRIKLDSEGSGDAELDRLFGPTESRNLVIEEWAEVASEDVRYQEHRKLYRGQVSFNVQVRHPRYPACIASLDMKAEEWWISCVEDPASEVLRLQEIVILSGGPTQRTITDDGRTPLAAIREIAKYTALLD